jgi:hypothetical protein
MEFEMMRILILLLCFIALSCVANKKDPDARPEWTPPPEVEFPGDDEFDDMDDLPEAGDTGEEG